MTEKWSLPQARALTTGRTVFRRHRPAVPRHVPAGVEPVGAGTRTLFYTVGRPSPTYARLSERSAQKFSATAGYCRLAPGLKELNLLSAYPLPLESSVGIAPDRPHGVCGLMSVNCSYGA